MTEPDWDFYWEMRLRSMETLGKRAAILAGSRLLRDLAAARKAPLRVLEPGCGEGQVVGALVDAHGPLCDRSRVIGVDYNPRSLAACRRDFPGWQFVEGDVTTPGLLASFGPYDLVLLVNALHEVFSFTTDPGTGEVDVPAAKARVQAALEEAVRCLAPGGVLLLFDGLEPPGDAAEPVQLTFRDAPARAAFETFAAEYRPFRVTYRASGPLRVTLARRFFIRYLTKSIFLGKALWASEQFESYQYFTEAEFRAAFAQAGLRIDRLETLTVNEDKWRRWLLPPRGGFPAEHVLIVGKKNP